MNIQGPAAAARTAAASTNPRLFPSSPTVDNFISNISLHPVLS